MNRFFFILGLVMFLIACDSGNTDESGNDDTIVDRGINDSSKRNENWGWVVDSIGNGKWLPTGDQKPMFTGSYTVFYSTGEIYETGFIREGLHEDTSTAYSKSGEILRYVIYANDSSFETYYVKDGAYLQTLQAGGVKFQGTIKDHQPYGEFKQYNNEGILTWEANVKDGVGWRKNYFESGGRKDSTNYVGNKQNGLHYMWYENGQVSQITNWKDEVQDGDQLYYFDNGQLLRKDFWKNGDVHGHMLIYYSNGNLQYDMKYVNGKRDGTVMAYHENGKLMTKGACDNGVIIGKWYHYDESGKLIQIDTYENGVLLNTENK